MKVLHRCTRTNDFSQTETPTHLRIATCFAQSSAHLTVRLKRTRDPGWARKSKCLREKSHLFSPSSTSQTFASELNPMFFDGSMFCVHGVEATTENTEQEKLPA